MYEVRYFVAFDAKNTRLAEILRCPLPNETVEESAVEARKLAPARTDYVQHTWTAGEDSTVRMR